MPKLANENDGRNKDISYDKLKYPLEKSMVSPQLIAYFDEFVCGKPIFPGLLLQPFIVALLALGLIWGSEDTVYRKACALL
ncbi:hypothetical protein TWF694_002538 [Orbilia ellipsospora]|uniref:Uncharacterized protein n=1 Tax=Orbilia ellipsospora TaxID=2528407 RepID=A0AAV9X3K6_9PEZI